MADRAPRSLAGAGVLDLGVKRVRHLGTPQVRHGWEARVISEETTATLGDADQWCRIRLVGRNGSMLGEQILEGPGRPDLRTVLAGWDPDQTWWLTDSIDPTEEWSP